MVMDRIAGRDSYFGTKEHLFFAMMQKSAHLNRLDAL
jgi:hypothetical protein